tara:strand:- start:883 stop:1770 length:888 start_codon:yes stop_codon:yes gene_type:complete
MLPEKQQPLLRPIEFQVQLQVLPQQRQPVWERNLLPVFALENPRISDCGAANHHPVTAGVRLHALDIRRRAHIAVANHRHRKRLLHRRDGIPIGVPGISLNARTRVHRHQAGAVLLQCARHLQIIARVIVPSQPDFCADRNLHSRDQSFHQPRNQARVAHHSSASSPLSDLLHKTAHVDIDNVGAEILQPLRGIHNAFHIMPVKLKHNRALVLAEAQLLLGAQAAAAPPLQLVHVDEFGVAQRRAQRSADRPKRQIGESRHRSENQISEHRNSTDVEDRLRSHGHDYNIWGVCTR